MQELFNASKLPKSCDAIRPVSVTHSAATNETVFFGGGGGGGEASEYRVVAFTVVASVLLNY